MSHAARAEPVAIPWPTRPLAELAETFSDGDWIESKDQSPSGVRLLQTGNVGKGEFKDRGEKARFISADTFARLNCTEVFEGDILVSRLPDPVGRACIVPESDERMITAVDCSIVRLDGRRLLPKFLVYFTQSEAYLSAVEAQCTGTTRSRISRSALGRIEIPVPSLDEQKRIVAALDQALATLDRARANVAASLADAQGLMPSIIEHELRRSGGKPFTLQQLMDDGAVVGHLDGNHGSDYPRKEEFVSSGVPYISANCIVDEEIDLDRAKFLSSARAAQMRKGIAQDGDVIFAHNATVGPVALLRTSHEKVVLGTSLTYYRCDTSKILPEFLLYEMRGAGFKAQYEAVMRQATRSQVPITMQRTFTHTIPEIEEQHLLVTRCSEAEQTARELTGVYVRRLAELADLRQSLLQAAFSGQLS